MRLLLSLHVTMLGLHRRKHSSSIIRSQLGCLEAASSLHGIFIAPTVFRVGGGGCSGGGRVRHEVELGFAPAS